MIFSRGMVVKATSPGRRLRPVAACLALLILATAAQGEDFQAQPSATDDAMSWQWDWTNSHTWLNSHKKPAVPATAADTGIVSAGHHLGAFRPLGTPSNRPTIRVEKGGWLFLLNDLEEPLVLAGGTVNGFYFGKVIKDSITVTADSELYTIDDAGGPQLRIAGMVSSSAPVTLHCDGGIAWLGDSSKTFSGTIAVGRGCLYLEEPANPEFLGSGPVVIAAGAAVMVSTPSPKHELDWSKDVSGSGTIWARQNWNDYTLTVKGATITPGMPGSPAAAGQSERPFVPGTLSIHGSVDFQRSASGAPGKLAIRVSGDPAAPAPNYGQLVILGELSNTLNNLDLAIELPPDITAEQAERLDLIILSANDRDAMGQPDFHSFHSVAVTAGNRTGSAKVKIYIDPLSEKGVVEVTGISIK